MRESERGGQSGRKGDRKYLVCLKEGMEGCEINRKTDKQRQTTNLFTLTHCASER